MKGDYESLFNKLKAILANSYFLKIVFLYLAMSINVPKLQFTLYHLSFTSLCLPKNTQLATNLTLYQLLYSHTLHLSDYFWILNSVSYISHPQTWNWISEILHGFSPASTTSSDYRVHPTPRLDLKVILISSSSTILPSLEISVDVKGDTAVLCWCIKSLAVVHWSLCSNYSISEGKSILPAIL